MLQVKWEVTHIKRTPTVITKVRASERARERERERERERSAEATHGVSACHVPEQRCVCNLERILINCIARTRPGGGALTSQEGQGSTLNHKPKIINHTQGKRPGGGAVASQEGPAKKMRLESGAGVPLGCPILQVLCILTVYSKDTRALTFENF